MIANLVSFSVVSFKSYRGGSPFSAQNHQKSPTQHGTFEDS